MNCGLETSIPDWIIEYPLTSKVFAEFGLDTSCGGRSLEYVCQQRDVGVELILKRLEQVTEVSMDQ